MFFEKLAKFAHGSCVIASIVRLVYLVRLSSLTERDRQFSCETYSLPGVGISLLMLRSDCVLLLYLVGH